MIDFGYGIELDTINSEDWNLLQEWRNDPRIYNWCRQVGLVNNTQQIEWIKSITYSDKNKMYEILSQKDSFSRQIGVCGLTNITHTHNTAEFSIYIAPEHQKQGHATAALKTLIRHGFDDLNLNRIWGETFDGNPGIALYKRLGFKKEGTLRQTYYKKGEYIDSHIYSILRGEYVEY